MNYQVQISKFATQFQKIGFIASAFRITRIGFTGPIAQTVRAVQTYSRDWRRFNTV